jgi:uncharacterized membrane protein YidH (DUF202 family)
MHFGELLIGIVLIAVGSLLYAIGRARDGQVRSFLSSDGAQAYYAILVIGLVAYGLVNLMTAVIPGESMESFKVTR